MKAILTRGGWLCYAGGMRKLSLLALFSLFAAFPLMAQDAEFYFNRGVEYAKSGDFDLALEDFNTAIALDPNYAEAWNGRGNAYYKKGDFDRAITNWTEAIGLEPDYTKAYMNRGLAYGYKEQWDQCIQDWNEVLRLEPDFPELKENLAIAYSIRGNAYKDKGELDRAIEDYSKAIALDTYDVAAWNNRGNAYYAKGELDRAIEDYSKAIALDPYHAFAWGNRGLAYRDKGELDQAIKDLDEAIILDPNLSGLLNNRGNAYYAKGESDRAIEDYSKAIGLDQNLAMAWNNRGLAYANKGEFDWAIEDYNKAIALDPNYVLTWINRGTAYYDKGELDLAITDYRQSIEAADKSANMREIFFLSWQLAGNLYNRYSFLRVGIMDNIFDVRLSVLICEALSRSIARAEKARSTLGARGAQIMTGLLYQYYAAVDFEAVFGTAEQAFTYSEALRSRGFLEQMGTEAALNLPRIQKADADDVRRLLRDIDNLRDLLSRLNPQTDGSRYANAGNDLTGKEAELAKLDADLSEKVPRYADLRNPGTATLSQAVALCGDNQAILEYVIWDDSVEFRAPSSPGSQSSYTDRPSINSYCLVITKDGITPVRLDPAFDYAATIEALRSKLFTVNERGNIIPNDESVFEAERNALYNALIKPVLEHIPMGIENLLIVPDSNLAFLPFDILRENNASSTRNLGERYSITLSPSVSVSVLAAQKDVTSREPIIAFGGAWYRPYAEGNRPDLRARYNADNRLASLGERLAEYRGRGSAGETPQEKARAVDFYRGRGWSYLAGTVAEIQGLERIATVAPTIIQGKDVSKRRVKDMSNNGDLQNYPIVHFACHGFFNKDLTPQAALVFSEVSGLIKDESEEDGYLSIEDIALLQLKARMVMLSACETGLGQRGDGMSGLARAFMVAGSQNVGVSLWEIDDEATAQFMWNVYRKVIREGKSFREAYQEAKVEFRSSAKWSHPYYWAAFTMYE